MAAERSHLPSPGRFTQLIGLRVDDAARYAEYRAGMTPILHAHGGAFGLDLEVARVLKLPGELPVDGAPNDGAINRVFSIGFPSREAHARFFADAGYLAVRARHFEPAVSRVFILAEWGE
jgi:uncharacterized protein (DUF1330 family)